MTMPNSFNRVELTAEEKLRIKALELADACRVETAGRVIARAEMYVKFLLGN